MSMNDEHDTNNTDTKITSTQVLNNIKRRFREETFTRESIEGVIKAHPDLIRLLYVNFAMVHYPSSENGGELMYIVFFFFLRVLDLTVSRDSPSVQQANSILPTPSNCSTAF